MHARLAASCLALVLGLPWYDATAQPPKEAPAEAPRELDKGARIIARHVSGVAGVAFSPDGKLLATAGGDRLIRLSDVETGKEVRCLEGHLGFIRKVVFAPDGKVLASAGDDRAVFLWNTATGKELRRVGHHAADLRLAAFSPDGKTLVSSGFDEHIGIWDAATGKELHFFRAHPRVPYSVVFAPNGKVLASSGDKEGTIRLWDVGTGKEVRHWDGRAPAHQSVAFSPDGRLLASGGEDNVIRLWEVATAKEVRRLEGHTRAVGKVVFAPDGRTLASAGEDQMVCVWETITGKQVRCFREHSSWVWDVAYSPSGLVLASGSHDGTAKLHDLTSAVRDRLRRSGELSAAELDAKWKELASGDAVRAFDATLLLSLANSRQVVPFLRDRLHPTAAVKVDATRLKRLIQELDDDVFAVREKAERELEKLGDKAADALREALAKPPSLEAKRRLEALVEALEVRGLPDNQLQALRALRVLEGLNTQEARDLLEKLATGGPDDLLTREAAAVLARLDHRRPTRDKAPGKSTRP